MPELVSDCPRCGSSKVTFDVSAGVNLYKAHDWQVHREVFAVCRHCRHSTILAIADKDFKEAQSMRGDDWMRLPSLTGRVIVKGFLSIADVKAKDAPEALPPEIEAAYREGAKCMAVGCYNAGATMFRLCLDHATRALLPDQDEQGLTQNIRRSLGLRLQWLFRVGRLPEAFRDLATCVKDDGNDGAHAGNLSEDDADDLQEFAFVLLERLYTEPAKLKEAADRRAARRAVP